MSPFHWEFLFVKFLVYVSVKWSHLGQNMIQNVPAHSFISFFFFIWTIEIDASLLTFSIFVCMYSAFTVILLMTCKIAYNWHDEVAIYLWMLNFFFHSLLHFHSKLWYKTIRYEIRSRGFCVANQTIHCIP